MGKQLGRRVTFGPPLPSLLLSVRPLAAEGLRPAGARPAASAAPSSRAKRTVETDFPPRSGVGLGEGAQRWLRRESLKPRPYPII
jgi:hypothetical protein